MINPPPRPLVADPDVAFLQKILFECKEETLSPIVVNSGPKLAEALTQNSTYSSVFLNPRLIRPQSGCSLRLVRELLPNAPIFFLLDEAAPVINRQELRRLTISACLTKPFSYNDLRRAILRSPAHFDPQSTLEMAKNDIQPLDVEFEDSDDGFSPIRAKNFTASGIVYFDTYVKINSRRYVKILRAGDVFSAERINQYLAKKVEHFFIRTKMQESYLQYCDKFTDSLLVSDKIPLPSQTPYVLNLGEEAGQFLRSQGVREPSIKYAVQFAKKSLELSIRVVGSKDSSILKHLQENTQYDHAVSVTMVASLLATRLNFDHERATRIVGLAAMLHDVGMMYLPPELQNADPTKLTSTNLLVYEAHPIIGQNMLKQLPHIESVIVQAVAQHHERRDGHGYPHRLKSGSINVVAEIVGLSEEFIRLVKFSQTNPTVDPVREMEKVLNGFSFSTAAAFRALFPT